MRRAVLALTVLTATATAGTAQGLPWPGPGTPASGGGASYTGPCDSSVIATAPLHWWGFRACGAANRGTKAINLCNVGDANCVDVNSDATTGLISSTQVVGAITCGTGANQCTVQYLYDQGSGGASNTAQYGGATSAVRPQFKPNCLGSLPCMTVTATSTQYAQAVNLTDLSQPFSTSTVAQRTANFTTTQHGFFAGSYLYWLNSANTMAIYAGVNLSATANDSTWHAAQGVANNTACHIYIDGSDTSGTCSTNTSGTNSSFSSGGAPADAFFMEGGLWNFGFTSGNMSSLNSNQHTVYGF